MTAKIKRRNAECQRKKKRQSKTKQNENKWNMIEHKNIEVNKKKWD